MVQIPFAKALPRMPDFLSKSLWWGAKLKEAPKVEAITSLKRINNPIGSSNVKVKRADEEDFYQ